MLTTDQELEMMDSLVEPEWPREKAQDVVRAVSTRGADLKALLAELEAQKIITAMQSLQVQSYLQLLSVALTLKGKLRPNLRAPLQITPSNPYFIAFNQ